MKTVRWLDDKLGRMKGKIETNDDDLAEAWQKAGFVEIVKPEAAPEPEPETHEAAVDAPPVNRSMKGKGAKTR